MPVQGRQSRGLTALNRTFKEQGSFSISREHKKLARTFNLYPLELESKKELHWGGLAYILFLHFVGASFILSLFKTLFSFLSSVEKSQVIVAVPTILFFGVSVLVFIGLIFMYHKTLKISSLQAAYVLIYAQSFMFFIQLGYYLMLLLFRDLGSNSGILYMASIVQFIVGMSLCGYITMENVSALVTDQLQDRRKTFIIHLVLLIGQIVSLLLFLNFIYGNESIIYSSVGK